MNVAEDAKFEYVCPSANPTPTNKLDPAGGPWKARRPCNYPGPGYNTERQNLLYGAWSKSKTCMATLIRFLIKEPI